MFQVRTYEKKENKTTYKKDSQKMATVNPLA